MLNNKRDHLDDSVPGEETSRLLSCDLTNDEQRERGVQQANAFDVVVRLKAEAKGVADEFKAKIASAEQVHNTLKNAVLQKREYRDVDCTEWRNYKKAKVYIVRDDLGIVVETRDMTKAERQPQLDLLLESKADGRS